MKLTQQQTILKLLKEKRIVSNYELVYEHNIKQAGTRIYELKEQGYLIESIPFGKSVKYELLGEVDKNAPQVTTAPQKGIVDIIREQQDNQIRVWSEKLQRYTWEDKREAEQQMI